MSGISGVSDYSTALQLWQQQNQIAENNSQSQSSAASAQSSAASVLSNLASSESTGDTLTRKLSSLVELVRYAMDDMGLDADSRVTFSHLTEYRAKVEDDFNALLKSSLEAAGVDPSAKFTLQVNDEGGVTVQGADADTVKAVQAVFDGNEDLVKAYKKMEAFSGLDKAREAMQISPTESRRRIQMESLAVWWDNSGDSASSWFSTYADGSLSRMSGINLSV
ncbi:MAG: hypothetical protein K6F46_00315 [Desulfovibrio sp.]|nr:hypothetical protein [Desulfovibrio sp.]